MSKRGRPRKVDYAEFTKLWLSGFPIKYIAKKCTITIPYVKELRRTLKLKRRTTDWLNEYDFVKKHRLLIPIPPKCICGQYDYRFKIEPFDCASTVRAKCNNCNYDRYFYPTKNKWGPYFN